MSQVFLASRNAKKLAEMQRILAEHLPGVEVLGLDDVAPYDEPAETEPTFEGNAVLKALAGVRATGLPSLADDSGLCVDALNGMPGVLSARWAGVSDAPRQEKDDANNALLLAQLADVPDERRGAAFVCAVAFAVPGEEHAHVVDGTHARPGDPRDPGERRLRLRRAVLRRGPRRHHRGAVGGREGRDLAPGQGAAGDRAAGRARAQLLTGRLSGPARSAGVRPARLELALHRT